MAWKDDGDGNLSRELGPIPPDPEDMNDDRAEWAGAALNEFIDITGTDRCDALADLLVDLMHLADRDGTIQDFESAIAKAQECYKDETLPFDEIEEVDAADVVGTPEWVAKQKGGE